MSICLFSSVLGIAIAYLSGIHLHRQFYLHETCNLDITGTLSNSKDYFIMTHIIHTSFIF